MGIHASDEEGSVIIRRACFGRLVNWLQILVYEVVGPAGAVGSLPAVQKWSEVVSLSSKVSAGPSQTWKIRVSGRMWSTRD